MRIPTIVAGLVVCVLLPRTCRAQEPVAQDPTAEYEQLLERGNTKLLRGDLLAARRAFEELYEYLVEDGVDATDRFRIAAEVGLQDIEIRSGHYESARKALLALPEKVREERAVALVLAEAHRRIGEYAEAIALLRRLVAADGDDRQARHLLGEVLALAGQRRAAREQWQQNAALPPADDGLQLAFQARSLFRLGGRQQLERCSEWLVQSMTKAPERPEARTTYGELLFRAYGETAGFPSGERELNKVLEQNGDDEQALLAMYRLRSANMVLDGGKTEGYLTRLLERNPRCVDALLLRAANVLDDRRFETAARLLDEILAIDPNHRETLCHRAAAAFLLQRSDEYRQLRERALAGDPGWPECDRILGEHLVRLYRFADAVPFFEAALAVAPEHVPSMHGLAKALIYCGEGARARELLLRAKELEQGLVDPWRNNAIAVEELLDEQYDTVEHGPFTLRLHRSDRDVLREYLLPIHLEAVEVLGRKYGWQPGEKTTVEVFHTWDDFSVRTIGFRGFTALGACFGRLITLVSPVDNDLRKQDFMWEATAWHEYTHVLTLGLSRHRVPRWLTEGFSVYEERARDPSWERGMQRDLFDAFHNRDIPPVHLMNRLFRGPRILFGYYQGGLIVELIAQRYGFDKALELLRAFGDDEGLERAFQRALGMSSRQFDAVFLEHVEQRLLRGLKLVPRFNDAAISRRIVAARRDPSDLDARIDLAWAALQRDNPVDAGRWLAEVLRQDPEHGAGQLVRAEMLRRRGQLQEAVEFYRRGFARGANDFDSRIACGDTLKELGDLDGAIDQYQRAKACWPSCTEQDMAPELRLAAVYRDRGERTQAQMEMKAFCRRTARAFAPRYTLAEFERQAGNRSEELRFLTECNRIDPFYRELHVRMAEALLALDRVAAAAREFEVAAAVAPEQDRAYLFDRTKTPPDAASDLAERARLWLRAAELRHRVGDRERRDALLRRVLDEAGDTDAAHEARERQQQWRGR